MPESEETAKSAVPEGRLEACAMGRDTADPVYENPIVTSEHADELSKSMDTGALGSEDARTRSS